MFNDALRAATRAERLGAKLGAIRLVNEVDRARDRAFDIRRALRLWTGGL